MADIQQRSDASAIVYNHVGAFEYNPRNLPAIPLKVEWPHIVYLGLLYIDDVTCPEDPVMVAAWDFWEEESPSNLGPHYHHLGGQPPIPEFRRIR